MIIKQLSLSDGLIDRSCDSFSEKRNLIHSGKNSCGKSTFLRLLFYALGYPIPNMKGMNFSHIETSMIVEEKGKIYKLDRHGSSLDVYEGEKQLSTYSLPSQHEAVLAYIFDYEKVKVLKNLLGFIYIDQDKGWSLLNRGTVIGKIKFGIEELLAGVNGKDISGLLERKKCLKINKAKYEAIQNIQQLQEQVYENNGEIFESNEEKKYQNELSFEKLKKANIKKGIAEINNIILEEKRFFDYIDSMNLFVKNGLDRIPVNRDTLDNSFSIQQSMKVRKSILAADLEKQEKRIKIIEEKLADYKMKNNGVLFEMPDIEKEISKKIAQVDFDINQATLSDLIEKNNDTTCHVNKELKEMVKNENPFVTKIYNLVVEYAKQLNVDQSIIFKEDFIFTSDLKLYSGAVLQKIVFAFKLAFLKVIEEDMNTKLFMVLDSPKGKELDEENTQLIMNLVKKELDNNQVFVASIYNFDAEKKIEIVNQAIEER